MAKKGDKLARLINIPIIATKIKDISGETVTIAAGAAGTVKTFQLNYSPVLDSGKEYIGGYGDSSLSFATGVFDVEVESGTADADLANGEYWIDYATGHGRGKKKTTGTSESVSYSVREEASQFSDPMVYMGVIDCSSSPNYPAADAGYVYVVSVAGKIGGASGENVEAGDMIICNTDGSAAGDEATVGTQWDTIQANIDGAVTGPASATDNAIPLFNGVTGKIIDDSGIVVTGGANTFVMTKGTAVLDIAAGATVNVDYNLGVNGISAINQDVQTSGSPMFAGITIKSANPTISLKDSSCTDDDVNATIDAQATDTGSGTEDIDVAFKSMVAGSLYTFLNFDADGVLALGYNGQAIQASPDSDVQYAFGKMKFGYNGTDADFMNIAHYDQMGSTSYAFGQTANGDTYINAPSSKSIAMAINAVVIGTLSVTGLTGNAGKILSFDANGDTTHILGRGKLGYDGSSADSFVISHYDLMGTTSYGMRISSAGSTQLNAATGQVVAFSINNVQEAYFDNTGLVFADPGTSANSYKLTFIADNSGTPQYGEIYVAYGASPYMVFSPPNASGTATQTIHFDDTGWYFTNDNTVDIGAAGANRPKDLYIAGTAYIAGSIGATGSRVTKGWFTDLEVTNDIAGSITGNAATVTNGVYTTSQVTVLAAADAADKDKYLHANASTGTLEWVTIASGTPTAITVADESSDTTCFPLFVTAATGDLGPKTNSGFTFDSSTGDIGITGIVTIGGLPEKKYSGTLADDATIALATGVSGELSVWDGTNYGIWFVKTDGTCILGPSTGSCDDADTDGYLCVYDGGSGAVIKNRTGGSVTVRYIFNYS